MIKLIYKKIRFEFHLGCFLSYLNNEEKVTNWWDKMRTREGSVYLGAIPFRSHLKWLHKLKIKRVLSCIEPFEEGVSFFGFPIKGDKWEKAGIERVMLSIEDFKMPTINQLHTGADFIHMSVNRSLPVYVHCKAGRGRSALMVAAYLIKYEKLSVEKTVHRIKKRRHVVRLDSLKMQQLLTAFQQSCNTL